MQRWNSVIKRFEMFRIFLLIPVNLRYFGTLNRASPVFAYSRTSSTEMLLELLASSVSLTYAATSSPKSSYEGPSHVGSEWDFLICLSVNFDKISMFGRKMSSVAPPLRALEFKQVQTLGVSTVSYCCPRLAILVPFYSIFNFIPGTHIILSWVI